MIDFIKKYKLSIILSTTGLAAGYLYWKYVGCVSGGCPITSNWYYTTLFGGLIGYFVADSIMDRKKKL